MFVFALFLSVVFRPDDVDKYDGGYAGRIVVTVIWVDYLHYHHRRFRIFTNTRRHNFIVLFY